MGLAIGLDVLLQLLLGSLQIPLGGGLHFALRGEPLASSVQLLVIEGNLVGQGLLQLVVLERGSHLSLVGISLLALSLVQHIPQQVQDGGRPVVGLVGRGLRRLPHGELRVLLGLQERRQALLVAAVQGSGVSHHGEGLHELLHLRVGHGLQQAGALLQGFLQNTDGVLQGLNGLDELPVVGNIVLVLLLAHISGGRQIIVVGLHVLGQRLDLGIELRDGGGCLLNGGSQAVHLVAAVLDLELLLGALILAPFCELLVPDLLRLTLRHHLLTKPMEQLQHLADGV
mmetsp:Transcript_18504/g.41028  ORF Transcript_18504/g.41028 Transcript_18504/m.41028 type:complete len:285 (+) Transcript_18504:1144-1998(+)